MEENQVTLKQRKNKINQTEHPAGGWGCLKRESQMLSTSVIF